MAGAAPPTLSVANAQLAAPYAAADAEHARRLRRWHDEQPLLDAAVAAMTQTREIIQREQAQAARELSDLKAAMARHEAAAAAAAATTGGGGGGDAQAQAAQTEDLELAEKLGELTSKVAQLDWDIADLAPQLRSCRSGELDIHQTKLVVLQDTKRILTEEVAAIRAELKQREAAARYARDRARAERLGCGDMSRLAEQLAANDAKLDRVKQSLYFPEVGGFRFTGGGNGVYVGAKDLFVSEVSGRFELALQLTTRPDGSNAARLTATLSGASGAVFGSPSKKRSSGDTPAGPPPPPQQQQQQQQPAQPAAPPEFLSRTVGALGSGGGTSGAGGGGGATSVAPGQGVPIGEGVEEGREQPPGREGAHTARAAAPGNVGAGGVGGGGAATASAGDGVGFPVAGQPGLQLIHRQQHGEGRLEGSSAGGETPALAAAAPRGGANGAASPHHGGGGGGGGSAASSPQVPAGGGVTSARPSPLGSGSRDWSAQLSASAVPKRGAAVARFLSNLTDNKDKLRSAISSAGEALERSRAPPRPDSLSAEGGSPTVGRPSGLQQLAHAFADKRRGAAAPSSNVRLASEDSGDFGGHTAVAAAAAGAGAGAGSGAGLGTPGVSGGGNVHHARTLSGDDGGDRAPQRLSTGLTAMRGKLGGLLNESKAGAKQLIGRSETLGRGLLAEGKGLLEKSEVGIRGVRASLSTALDGGSPNAASSVGRSGVVSYSSDGGAGAGAGPDSGRAPAAAGVSPPAFRDPTPPSGPTPPGSPPPPPQPPPSQLQLASQQQQDLQERQRQQLLLLRQGAAGGASPPRDRAASPATVEAPAPAALGAVATPTTASSAAAASMRSAAPPAVPPAAAPATEAPRPTSTAAGAAAPPGADAVPGSSRGQRPWEGPGEAHALDLGPDGPGAGPRRGLHVTVLGEGVEVVGEKGTKVPNIRARELHLEVEASMSAVLEYSPVLGWQLPERLSFEVTRLERRVEGANIPLPAALLRSVLNMVIPSVFTKLLLTSLPHELGRYVVESGEGVVLAGELACKGPDPAVLRAPLSLGPGDPPPNRAAIALHLESLRAAQKARSLVGLNLAQARALASLWLPAPAGLLPPAFTAGASSASCSVSELCRFWLRYGDTGAWGGVCEAWETAVEAACAAASASSPPLSFSALLEGRVAAMARKPVRIGFALETLRVGLDADAALNSVRDYFERVVREYAQNSSQEGRSWQGQALEAQLEGLGLWHASMVAGLRAFRAQFKSAGAGLLASADRRVFQLGAEDLHYEGPLRLKLPLALMTGGTDGSVLFDIKLPHPKDALNSLAYKVGYLFDRLTMAAFGTTRREQELAAAQAQEVEALLSREDLPPDLQASLAAWRAARAAADPASDAAAGAAPDAAPARARSASGGGGAGGERLQVASPGSGSGTLSGAGGAAAPQLLTSPSVGTVRVRRVAVGLKLDERRLAQLLTEGLQDGGLVSSLLGCYGPMFSAEVAPTGRRGSGGGGGGGAAGSAIADGGAGGGSREPTCVVNVCNNEVTRVRADVESLLFQSAVPPRIAVRLLHAVALAAAAKFQRYSGKQLKWLDTLFCHLHEYLSTDALDLLVCAHVSAAVEGDGRLLVRVRGGDGSGDGVSRSVGGGGGSGGAGGGRGGKGVEGGSGAEGVWPLYLVNDVSLIQVLETAKLVMDV